MKPSFLDPPNLNGGISSNTSTTSPTPSRMAPSSSSLLILLLLLLLAGSAAALNVAVEFLYPNFTVSNLYGVDNTGVFLVSGNRNFAAVIDNPGRQQSRFYLCVIHSPTNTIIWSANRGSPVTSSGLVKLTAGGISISGDDGSLAWSTPPLRSPAQALQLLDDGNIVLLDAGNGSLWRSFDHPTDTIVSGQILAAGSKLVGPVSDTDLSEGAYSLVVTSGDALLRWIAGDPKVYWSLSTDPRSIKDSNDPVSFMALNTSGFFLGSGDGGPGSKIVIQVSLPSSPNISVARIDHTGKFRVSSFVAGAMVDLFVAPAGDCDLPVICEPLQLCSPGVKGSSCSCPILFAASTNGGCTPADGSILAASTNCSSGDRNLAGDYAALKAGVGYFANKFAVPAAINVDLAACRQICTSNCSCSGFFFKNSTGSCFPLDRQLGSLVGNAAQDTIGYIKVFPNHGSPPAVPSSSSSSPARIVAIALPSAAALLLVLVLLVVALQWWKRGRLRTKKKSNLAGGKEIHLGRSKSRTPAVAAAAVEFDDGEISGDDDGEYDISIPGLPTQFSFAELELATDNFSTSIGSGGFGEVFKGNLAGDKSPVAVKRISNAGIQGRKEFFTEIAVIGSIHHVNLVRLRGFCANGSRRLLVYEYMNRGSLDRSLFISGKDPAMSAPVLGWKERVEIAIGAARGLAYLHWGCEHRIIHCDVKPENILLQYSGEAKISDFGMAKLVSREQSALFTTMRGTRGYLAPEWLTSSAITDRTDVYSFGMVLLELVSGRKNGGGVSGAGAGEYFPLVAMEMHEVGVYGGLVDPRLGKVEEEEVGRVVRVALCCLHEEPALRPSMPAVVGMLEGAVPEWSPRSECLSFLRLYGRGTAATVAGAGAGGDVGAGSGMFYGGGGGGGWSMSSATTDSPSYILSAQDVSGPR